MIKANHQTIMGNHLKMVMETEIQTPIQPLTMTRRTSQPTTAQMEIAMEIILGIMMTTKTTPTLIALTLLITMEGMIPRPQTLQ